MNANEMKKKAAEAALQYLPEEGIIGVGTGTTVQYFIEALAKVKHQIEGTIASSKATENELKKFGIPVFELNTVDQVALYVDGADEVNDYFYLIKGRGGALTREKIIATVAKKFVCIIDESKRVSVLGVDCPVPVEVIPMARSYVARQLVKLGGSPVYREGCITDNGNIILDVYNLKIMEPLKLEDEIKTITGVVDNGLFAHRPADVILMSTPDSVESFKRSSDKIKL
ncbi:MAG: ribose-5-phosphate isomerase RpiA [Gammaproteobacteria bacterium]|nr:ribose-5-phosphate isomerase RpiA [Gammaproteobacteria bacterium]